MLIPAQEIELTVEKPAAGGRMIARHDGQVVLIAGAIPGERVVARVERVERRLAFATVVDVAEPSPDRRPGFPDPLCGGCVYSHISYERQLAIKADVVRDAFLRIGRIRLEQAVAVFPSAERGYRMRARLHVDGGRIGFYREGSHTLCDPAATGQLSGDALSAVADAVAAVQHSGAPVVAVELTENIAGSERAISVEVKGQPRRVRDGHADVGDALEVLTRGRVSGGELRRSAESFFQANRFVVPDLVTSVLDVVPNEGDVLDLYAGVGLFSMALAASGRRGIVAVEGDRTSGADLRRNAEAFPGAVTPQVGSVEAYLAANTASFPTVIVDPPRAGVSAESMATLVKSGASEIVYVSCDPATMARDARRLLDAGYVIRSLRGFDLFPNTPHIETLGVFKR
jgi:23S rRNA (uracil1939-C5)-methyltransferase